MTSLIVTGIAPFFDFTGLLTFVEKISVYLLIGVTLYFLSTTKEDIDAKHNSDPSTRDTMFNEILANRDARLTTELANRDARFDEIERILRTYHNSFERMALEFGSINESITMLRRIEPTEEAELQDNDSSG